MTHTRAWRNFRRMQDSALLFACLIYLGATLHAWRILPGPVERKVMFTLGFPSLFLALCALAFLAYAPGRRLMQRYVALSYEAGFGQTVSSILWGLGLLVFAALFIYWQIAGVAKGGRYPAGVFSGYAAGIGAILAQVVLVRRLEHDPEIRRRIEAPDNDPQV